METVNPGIAFSFNLVLTSPSRFSPTTSKPISKLSNHRKTHSELWTGRGLICLKFHFSPARFPRHWAPHRTLKHEGSTVEKQPPRYSGQPKQKNSSVIYTQNLSCQVSSLEKECVGLVPEGQTAVSRAISAAAFPRAKRGLNGNKF